MRTILWFSRVLKNGWLNLMRNKILAFATILVIALMFFVFNLVLALSFATESVIEQIGRKIDISVEIQPEVENYTIQSLVQRLGRRSDIKEVLLIDKATALKRFGSKYPNVIGFLTYHGIDNPLPNVIRIVTHNVAYNNRVIEFLEEPQFSRIINQEKLTADQEQKSRNQKVLEITLFIKNVGFWLNLIVALVAILILFNSINLNIHAHKHEIKVMQLVGAKHSFIKAGYLFEGLLYAVLALGISVAISRGVLGYLTHNLLSVIENESIMVGLNSILYHFEDQFWFTLSWQLLVAVGVGAISSMLAIHLYLRKNEA